MATDLTGRRVLAIVTNYGVEQDELVVPVSTSERPARTSTSPPRRATPIETLVGDKDAGLAR